jgi:BirA family biotin operon repressor/biotin-[acetyl-CoA-carboxylase] ligase
MFSLALTAPNGVESAVIGVAPLAAGVAVVEVCRALGVNDVALKWPNDVVITAAEVGGLPLKLGGILTERAADRVIVGIGLNVDLSADEAPTPQATSLRDHGLAAEVSREELLARIVAELVETWRGLIADGPAGVLARFTALCTTLGRQVLVSTPGPHQIAGEAVAIDETGRLVIRAADGTEQSVSAGDVTFGRPPSQ